MMPIAGSRDSKTFPTVNMTTIIVIINILVFVLLQSLVGDRFTFAFAMVPRKITTEMGFIVYLTLITSLFMHGSVLHLLGNMLFLWAFGDDLEDKLGRARYGLFYIVFGVVAGLSHAFMNPGSVVPTLGASGAISGVLACYLLLFPHRRAKVIVGRMLVEVPTSLAIGIWIGFELVQGWLQRSDPDGGIAYAAHIGGFISGLVLAMLFASGRMKPVTS